MRGLFVAFLVALAFNALAVFDAPQALPMVDKVKVARRHSQDEGEFHAYRAPRPERPATSRPSPYFLEGSTIVQVQCENSDGGDTGTAFYIGGGVYVTAAHVIEGQCFVAGQKVALIAINRKVDYAIFRAEHYPIWQVNYSCQRLRAGSTYYATGYAAGSDSAPATTVLRATGLNNAEDGTAEVNGSLVSGQSGGPVTDESGTVYALNDWRNDDGVPIGGVVELADTPLCAEKRI